MSGGHTAGVGAGEAEVRVVDPEHPDAVACLEAYYAELRRRDERGFDPTTGSTALPHELRPPKGLIVVVYLHGEPVGCGALKFHGEGVADIKRMWVADSVRGQGIGRRLLASLESSAREHGVTLARLETNRNLVEAIALYERNGYREVPAFNDEPYAHHWFAKAL